MSTSNKHHEIRRLNEATEARLLRRFSLSLHDPAAAGLDIDNIQRMETLGKLPNGLPLTIQQSGIGGFNFLPGVDGPVDPTTQV